jgi:hypothetical protein
MLQYEDKHKCFDFMGPSPIDFDEYQKFGECVWKELCEFNLKDKINDNKSKLGFIFNTDPHYSSGSHWISLFVDIDKKFVFYFDSTGESPPKEVEILIDKIISQGTENDIEFKYIINDNAHQKSETECGMYCLYMIISMLENKHTPYYLLKHRVSDIEMEKLRGEYFNIQ